MDCGLRAWSGKMNRPGRVIKHGPNEDEANKWFKKKEERKEKVKDKTSDKNSRTWYHFL